MTKVIVLIIPVVKNKITLKRATIRKTTLKLVEIVLLIYIKNVKMEKQILITANIVNVSTNMPEVLLIIFI